MNPWGAVLGIVLFVLVDVAVDRRRRRIAEDRPSSLRRALVALAGIQGKRTG